jgi:nucleotide-binding universal stress UspA family protein
MTYTDNEEMRMFRSIVIATDLLPTSLPALRAGLALAHGQGARATVVYVLEVWMIDRQWFTDITVEDIASHRALLQREEQAVKRELQAQVQQACLEQRLDLDVESIVRDGRAPDSIVAAAAERGSDLIVVGTRGRRNTLGSVAEQVVRLSRRPVLVVPFDV